MAAPPHSQPKQSSMLRMQRKLIALLTLLFAAQAFAAPPTFTGDAVVASGATSIVNLRAQGAIEGTAPMNVQVNGVRVGGVLSPLISILRTVLQPGASASVCVEVQNLLGLDLNFLGVEVDVTVSNAEAPGGVSGRIAVQAGVGGEDISPQACADAAQLPPTANAGVDQSVADSDQQPGELVTLNGSASNDPDGTIASYQWLVGQSTVLATGAIANVRLPDGSQTITLRVTDDDGGVATDTVTITVAASIGAPVARAGADRTIADTDTLAGENVTLDGSASTDADGVIISYQWSLAGQPLATGVTATVRLPDGDNIVTLTTVDDDGASATDTLQVSIAAAEIVPLLSAIPGLTPNQLSVAVAMDSLCPRLSTRASQQALAADQADLLQRCNAIRFSSSTPEQITALDEISPQDLNATRTQTLNLSRSQLANVSDRLIALRGGARGLSLTGLNLQLDGKALPLNQMASAANYFLGGGASSDEKKRGRSSHGKSPDDFLDERLGVWLRGNYSFGDKDDTIADHGFDAHQWGLMSGVDFRFSPTHVAGIAVGYGRSEVNFNPTGQGGLNTKAVTVALYTTMYAKQGFYVDAIANYLQSAHDSQRRIVFTEGGAPRDLNAAGQTDGTTMGFAFTLGYDMNLGAFTIAPSMGYNYMETTVASFRERGANGLDLTYQQQSYSSGTANAGLRLTYAWKTNIGVIVPQIRGEYIREGMQDSNAFTVRFANDPFDDTPLILVQTDEPDRSYWRVAGGLSAQFRHGISGFVEYQRLESLEFFDYADVALGLRFETGFN